MQLDVTSIAAGLASANWTERISAQGALPGLRTSLQWKTLLSNLESNNLPIITVVTQELTKYISRAPASEIIPLFKFSIGPQSPLAVHKEPCREIMESFLAVKVVQQNRKIDTLIALFEAGIARVALPEFTFLYLIRALGILQAKKAIPTFEVLLSNKKDAVVLEAIRALRFFKDPKSGRFLESLFGSPKRHLASAAIAAYAELGGVGLLQALRLRSLYPKVSSSVRESILSAALNLNPWISIWMLVGFYQKEKEESIRYQIIKKLGSLPNSYSAMFLMKVSAREQSPKLRIFAGWSLNSMPAHLIEGAIRKGMASENLHIKKWAFLKAGELPMRRARKMLKPYYRAINLLPVMLRYTLIESMSKLPPRKSLTQWLLRRIGEDPVSTLTALSGLLRRTNTPILEVFERIDGLGVLPLQTVLSLVTDHLTVAQSTQILDKVKGYLKHESIQVRYLSARFLLSHKREDLFNLVWKQGLTESAAGAVNFADLIASALSIGDALPEWISIEHFIPPQSEHILFFKNILRQLKTTTWRFDQWRELVGLLNLDEIDARTVCLELFIKENSGFWGQTVNKLLQRERDPFYLSRLSFLGRINPGAITSESYAAIFESISTGQYVEPGPMLRLLSNAPSLSLQRNFVDWLILLPVSTLKKEAYRALSEWLKLEVLHG